LIIEQDGRGRYKWTNDIGETIKMRLRKPKRKRIYSRRREIKSMANPSLAGDVPVTGM